MEAALSLPPPTLPALIYNGVEIHETAERLSLTDMWRAAGSPSGRAPSDWLALTSTKEFVELIEQTFNAGKSGIEAKRGGSGAGRGGTFAHWQIAMNYARYLDPPFAAWCNSIVRERMKGHGGAALPSAADDPREIRLITNQALKLAKLAGLEGVHALHAASAQTLRITGHDTLKAMGLARLPAPEDEKPLIPTQIGQRLGDRSPRTVNVLLHDHGFQAKNERGDWIPTDKGRDAGAHFVVADRKHAEGVSYQLVWHPRIVDLLRALIPSDDNVLAFPA